MNKRLWVGVVLGVFLLLSNSVLANSLRETSELPGKERNETGLHEMRARWSVADDRNHATLLAFTSTSSANGAASLIQNSGGTLSFTNFGRVPFYQIATVRNERDSNSFTGTSSKHATTLPEPTTLLLLGSGLAALAAGLRKKSKNRPGGRPL